MLGVRRVWFERRKCNKACKHVTFYFLPSLRWENDWGDRYLIFDWLVFTVYINFKYKYR